MSSEILKDLNDEQKKAVISTEGYIRVIAGAGSGKTRALTHRYIYLVKELGISTSNILCVTFTNKAAKEMKKRIRNLIGDNDTALICTFHGFCRYLLREDIHVMNYPNNFIVMDIEDMNSVLKIVYEQANISSRNYNFSSARDIIVKRKGSMEHIEYILNMDINIIKQKFLFSNNIEDKIFFGYLYQQRKGFNLDFTDLITFALYILNKFPQKREKWQRKLQYIMVDEFQDVSSTQYSIVDILSRYHKNLFVVGDPDQTIYSWRGAKVEFILDFDKIFPNVKTIMMNTNYRSSEKILNASNSLIKKNEMRIEKELIPIKKSKTPVIYNHSKNTYDEARWISTEINKIINSGNKYSDICILYRAHYVSRSIEEIFIKEKIPYVLYSGIAFYERKEIKDILSYLRLIVFEDDLSLIRVINEPKRNFGKKRMEIIQNYSENNNCSLFNSLKFNIDDNLIAKSKASEFIDLIEKYQKIYKEMTITDLLTGILNDSGYEAMLRQSGEDERLENLSELKNAILDYENSAGEEVSLENYLQDIALYSNLDLKDENDNVKLMTIHTAKGLEFPYVFICGLNEGIFPSQRANTKEKLEEERRLAYVGYTRAENALFLSESEGVNYDGSYRYPSRFIFNTNKKYLKYNVKLEKELIDDAKEFINNSEGKVKIIQNTKFNIGDRIIHNVFGVGVINDIDNDNSSYIIKFNGVETIRTIKFLANMSKFNEKKEKERIEAEEARKKEEKRIKAEEARKKEEERIKAEEERKREEERIKAEEARKKEEKRIKAEEARKKEEERIKAEEERKREEERIKAEEARKKEEKRIKAEEARKKEEERIKAEEARKKEEERIKAEEERKREEERIKAEEARKREEERIKAEEARKKEEERIKAEEIRKREEERIKAEEARKKEEERIKAEEARKKEEERIKAEEEARKKEVEIIRKINIQEEIFSKYKYSFFGKGRIKKKIAKELILELKIELDKLRKK